MSVWYSFAHALTTHPWWTIAILLTGCLLLFHDLLTPLTWGWTGTAGMACVAVVLVAQRTVGTDGWTGIALLLAGVGLLLLEIHVFRGSGVAALCGFALLFSGMFVTLGGTAKASYALPVSAMLELVAIAAFFAFIPKSTAWREIGRSRSLAAATEREGTIMAPGLRGQTTTPLRPGGEALLDGRRVAVVTEGEFLTAGTPIVVRRVEGSRIEVDALEERPVSAAPHAQG